MIPAYHTARKTFALCFGGLLGLALLKFSTPPILEKLVSPPTAALEWVLNTWPVLVGHILLGLLALFGLLIGKTSQGKPRWLLMMPMVWLIWQMISTTQTVNYTLSNATLMHFAACVICFYLGYYSLPQDGDFLYFLIGPAVGLSVVIAVGCHQHFGGLEEVRTYFFTYIYTQTQTASPEYLKKISSNRIFSTLFYPNALAGALLLLMPITLTWLWNLEIQLTKAARIFLITILGIAGLACLIWSGSKGGWLLMLGIIVMAGLKLPLPRNCRLFLIGGIALIGLIAFTSKYAAYFQKGATSSAARVDYWRAAAKTAWSHPLLGSGPGTFGVIYKEIKKPESEMARLAHNDYLEQASDSGILGFLTYCLWIGLGLSAAFKNVKQPYYLIKYSIWIGLLAWFAQGMIEFSLYVPALAWIAFTLLGWLIASGNGFDINNEES